MFTVYKKKSLNITWFIEALHVAFPKIYTYWIISGNFQSQFKKLLIVNLGFCFLNWNIRHFYLTAESLNMMHYFSRNQNIFIQVIYEHGFLTGPTLMQPDVIKYWDVNSFHRLVNTLFLGILFKNVSLHNPGHFTMLLLFLWFPLTPAYSWCGSPTFFLGIQWISCLLLGGFFFIKCIFLEISSVSVYRSFKSCCAYPEGRPPCVIS